MVIWWSFYDAILMILEWNILGFVPLEAQKRIKDTPLISFVVSRSISFTRKRTSRDIFFKFP